MTSDRPYPSVPDPAWEYAQIWEYAMELEQESQQLRHLLANTEQASIEVDRQIRQHFLNIQATCLRALENLEAK